MSMPMKTKLKCSVCGFKSEQTILLSTNTFGPPDLDLRPASMMRETMCWWVQECPRCGYVAKSIDNDTEITKKWLASEEFKSLCERDFLSNYAKRFYKQYLICKQEEKDRDAFYAALHAAWSCDDAKDLENAIFCRKLALEKIDVIINLYNKREDFLVMKADLLRRSGQFDAVISEFKDKQFSKELLNQVVAFQLEKAAQKDTKCYTVAHVTGEDD